MRKVLLAVLLLIAVSVGYCTLPLTSVALLTVSLTDQAGRKITADSVATFLDAAGAPIVAINSRTPGSWDNHLHWWAHSSHETSKLRPADARRAVSVRIESVGCETVTAPVALLRTYEPPSLAPHGGGPAYLIYRYERKITLQCR